MPNELVLFLYYIMWYVLVVMASLFFIFGLDDLFFDIYYWVRYFRRIRKTRKFKPLTYKQLSTAKEQMIAILVPCWHEAGVIGTMLSHNCHSIDYDNYYIFVGVYPNDPSTVKEVEEVAKKIKHVQCVIGKTPGPTTKASNLNSIYLYAKEFEKKIGQKFEIFVFHDSEDIIHPLSFKIYNYICPRRDMIQIPIFPLPVNAWNFTHWLYADEFSENHTKDIIVRESIRGHVPSAGVGTAFARHTLEQLEDPKTHTPFATDSLTEDYRTSLTIRLKNMKSIFVTQKVRFKKWVPKGFFRKGYIQKNVEEYVATRALFPMEYTKAVRQKARWIVGIVFQEWKHSKWPKVWRVRFTLAHDRKAIISHFINGFGYFVLLFWIIYSLLTYQNPAYPSLQEQLNLHPWVWWLIVYITFMMLERMIQRMIAIKRVYGWSPIFLSIPRALYGNFLNLHALLRAYYVYYIEPWRNLVSNKQPIWDKTDHHFPGSHVLTPYRIKLGKMLVSSGLIQQHQLDAAILEQKQTGERLGEILSRLKLVSEYDFIRMLSQQYNLSLFPKNQLRKAKVKTNPHVPRKLKIWFRDHDVNVVAINKANNSLTISLDDPTNEHLIYKIINMTSPYEVNFVLTDPSSTCSISTES